MIGSLGFVALYRALAEGQMSTAAPVAALTSAILPVIVGFWRDGLPSVWMLAGFGLALAAIWLISQTGTDQPAAGFRWANLGLPLVAGLGMGAYFVLVNQGSQTSVFGALVAVRAAGAVTLLIFAAQQGALKMPARAHFPLMALNTALDVGGSLFYILAGQSGRMDLAALLASLYSGVTVGLAWLISHEKITRRQWLGILMTLAAIMLITR
ncbi:MAG: DMT family transporter [Chloroflexi bacterium]|nr:DMT family transporter [Chloroflexota bacterium]